MVMRVYACSYLIAVISAAAVNEEGPSPWFARWDAQKPPADYELLHELQSHMAGRGRTASYAYLRITPHWLQAWRHGRNGLQPATLARSHRVGPANESPGRPPEYGTGERLAEC